MAVEVPGNRALLNGKGLKGRGVGFGTRENSKWRSVRNVGGVIRAVGALNVNFDEVAWAESRVMVRRR